MKYKSTADRFIEAAEKTADIMLRYAYQKQMIMDSLLTDKELDRKADKVIERIKITADVSEIIAAIKEIQQELDDLEGKK